MFFQKNPDFCSISEKSRKEIITKMRENRDKSYTLKNELKAFISFLPSNKRKFKIEDLYLKENVCKIGLNAIKKRENKEIIEESGKNVMKSRNFYYKESNEMMSVTQFMSKYLDRLNMK